MLRKIVINLNSQDLHENQPYEFISKYHLVTSFLPNGREKEILDGLQKTIEDFLKKNDAGGEFVLVDTVRR